MQTELGIFVTKMIGVYWLQPELGTVVTKMIGILNLNTRGDIADRIWHICHQNDRDLKFPYKSIF